MSMNLNDPTIDLHQGSYWRSLVDLEIPGFFLNREDRDDSPLILPAGSLLLLQSIRDVDNTAHTIILRPHPTVYGSSVLKAASYKDGKIASWTWEKLTEYRLLVAEFLEKFVPEPDAELIRAREIAEAQQHIQYLTQKMSSEQNDPEVMKPVLALGVAEWEEQKGISSEQSEEIRTMSTSTALTPALTADRVGLLKLRVEREHQIATARANWIKERVEEVNEAVQALVPYMSEKAAAALSQTEDVIRKVGTLQKGIESLDLYVGDNVTVETLATGESAPSDVPLSIAQQKLFMQEEFSVWADVNDSFDYFKDEQFLKALVENDSLQRQIFPSDRAIVCMATRRTEKDYGDPWMSARRNEINREVFLLVKDGGNLYRVFSPVESHIRALQLFPYRAEIDAIFSGRDGSNIDFMDVRYTDKLEKHELVSLHYKRFLILLAGLDHRLGLFGKFYEGDKTGDFISLGFQKKNFRFVHDADGEGLLADTPRPSLSEWLKTNNSYLRVGSRVMCRWSVLANPKTAPGMAKESDSSGYRHGYYNTRHPQKGHEVVTTFESKGEIVVHCQTKSSSWGSRASDKILNTRVSISAYTENYYRSGMAYLVLDAIKADELAWYINDRASRIFHLEYIQLFKEALAYLRKVEEQEAPGRKALLDALNLGNVGDPAERAAIVDQTVISWRAANRGADLPTQIRGEQGYDFWNTMYTIQAAPDLYPSCIKSLADAGHVAQQPLRYIVTGATKLALYVEPKPEERDDRLTPHIWVHKFHFETRKNGKVKLVKQEWAVLPENTAAETTIKEWFGAESWKGLKSPFKSIEQKRHLLDEVAGNPNILSNPWLRESVTSDEWDRMFSDWLVAYKRANLKHSGRLYNPKVAALHFPIGVRVHVEKFTAYVISVRSAKPEARLWKLGNQEQRERLTKEYAKPYWRKADAAEELKAKGSSAESFKVSIGYGKSEVQFPAEEVNYFYAKVSTKNSNYQDSDHPLSFRWAGMLAYARNYETRHVDPPQPLALYHLSPALQGEGVLDRVFLHYTGKLENPEELVDNNEDDIAEEETADHQEVDETDETPEDGE